MTVSPYFNQGICLRAGPPRGGPTLVLQIDTPALNAGVQFAQLLLIEFAKPPDIVWSVKRVRPLTAGIGQRLDG
jgi:hypothetical protein